MKEKLLKYWFAISAAALVVLYAVIERRGRAIKKLHEDAQTQLLAQELLRIREKGHRSQEDYVNAKTEYEALKNRHADLLKRIGFSGRPSDRDN